MKYNLELASVIFKRYNKILAPSNKGNVAYSNIDIQQDLCTISKNIESLGFEFSACSFNKLLYFNNLKDWYKEILIPVLQSSTGANIQFNCMYSNFPEQVMDMSYFELYYNSIMYYYTGELRKYNKINRPILEKLSKLKKIDLLDSEYGDFQTTLIGYIEQFCNSSVSFSFTDMHDIVVMLKNIDCSKIDIKKLEIPNKENLALLTPVLYKEGIILKDHYHTTTDVLRLAVSMSYGDTSLSSNTKFKHFSRKERRLLLNILDNVVKNDSYLEDMFRYREPWLRIGEIIHPTEYRKRYPRAFKAFTKIRNNEKMLSFIGYIDNLWYDCKKSNSSNYELDNIVSLLQSRPGEYARRLDALICMAETLTGNNNYNSSYKVIDGFRKIADSISIPVLLQVQQHFSHRSEDSEYRVFIPKSRVPRTKVIKNEKPKIKKNYCNIILRICTEAIVSQLSKRNPLGKVYIDPDMKNYIVPFSLRNANAGSKILIRGSHIKIPKEVKVIRSFVWWTNNEDDLPIDIDLTATFHDENMRYNKDGNCEDKGNDWISFTNLKTEFGCHSGDITDGGEFDKEGSSEFIDIDIEKTIEAGYRYMVFSIFSFNGEKFSDISHCCFGWMNRKDCNSGEIFEPSTVQEKFDIKSKHSMCVPVIFDLVEREFIWCDMTTINIDDSLENMVENTVTNIIETLKSVIHINKPNLYNLIRMNVAARGEMINDSVQLNENDSITVFTDKEEIPSYITCKNVKIISPFEVDYFMSDMM